jgi:ABC-type nitrate/sulfonate/bicarbonate transport system substrate-binding protein
MRVFGSCRAVWLALAVLGSLLVAACGSPQSGAQAPKKVRVGYNKASTTPFLLIAKQQGAFQKAGVEVEWFEFQTAIQGLEAMVAGSVDTAPIPVPNLLTAIERGVGTKSVLHLAGWSEPTSTYFVRVDSGIESARDLKDKKVGISAYGGNFDLYLRQMLDANGLDPKKDVQILEIPISATYQALDTRQIDVGAVPPLSVPLGEINFPGKFKPLFSYKDIPGIGDRPQINQIVLAMSNGFVQSNRPAAKAFLKAIVDTQDWGHANREAAVEAWAAESGVRALVTLADPFGPNTRGKHDLPALELDSNLLNKYGYVKTRTPLKDVLDESLVDEILPGK